MGTWEIDSRGMTGTLETSRRRRPKFLLLSSPLWSPPWPRPRFWSTTSPTGHVIKARLSPFHHLGNSSPTMKSVIWWEATDLPDCIPCEWHVHKKAFFWVCSCNMTYPTRVVRSRKSCSRRLWSRRTSMRFFVINWRSSREQLFQQFQKVSEGK